MQRIIGLCLLIVSFLTMTGCQSGVEASAGSSENLQLKYATKISDENLSLLGTDYQRVAVDATVYKGLMEMLGVGDRCLDFSSTMKPDVEKIAASKPDLLMLSVYDGMDVAKYKQLGIPIVQCTDFNETTPLGRAEWIRYFGRLWSKGDQADSLFDEVEHNYNAIRQDSIQLPSRYRVETGERLLLFDLLYGSTWYQPAPSSTTGQIVQDAGGMIPFSSEQQGGSLALSAEQVLMQAKNADYWLVRAYGKDSLTLDGMAGINPIYTQFKAYKTGNVYVCYTDKTNYFEETPFRPDLLLQEFRGILQQTNKLRYFQRVK